MAQVLSPEKTHTPRMSAEERRHQIVAVAGDLFSQKGFSGTTTKEIADRAGVSEAIIFRHFATKRDLYSAIIDYKTRHTTQDLQSQLEEAAGRRDDRAFFFRLAFGKLESYAQDPSLMRLLLFSALEGHELTDIFFESANREVRNYVRNYIGQRIAEGAFRDIDPAVCARAFAGAVFNQAQVLILFSPCNDVELSSRQIAEAFVDLFLNGLEASRDNAERIAS